MVKHKYLTNFVEMCDLVKNDEELENEKQEKEKLLKLEL